MRDISDLIARLEKATGPDRELDEAIVIEAPITKAFLRGNKFGGFEVLPYTASLDAALTLVPEGWQWQVSNRAPAPHAGRAYLNNRELFHIGGGGLSPNPAYRGSEETAATPAIAVCIAALNIRNTTTGD